MKIAIIADDLTGSNVNGALLTAEGFFSATCLDASDWDREAFPTVTAVAVSTDSRLLTPQDAAQKVYETTAILATKKPALFAKRIDSTLRGNLGAEIEAALRAMDDAAPKDSLPAVAVAVPAYPASGRVAVGGYLIVHGVALQRSRISKDPATPISSSAIAEIISQQISLRLGMIDLGVVLSGPAHVRTHVERLYKQGCRIICCDAVSDEDIITIAQALCHTSFPILAVDPGPFTAKLAAVRFPSPGVEFKNKVLAIVGSPSELTRRQIEALNLAHATHIVNVDSAKFLDPAAREQEIARAVQAVLAAPASATVLGVCTAEKTEDVLSLQSLSASLHMSTSHISQTINSALAAIADQLLAKPHLRIGALYTSGGEVTVATIRRLNGKGFSVRGEILPLAVYGRLLEGKYPDLPMATKGGFVGDTDSLVHCIEYLFTKISTKTRQQPGTANL